MKHGRKGVDLGRQVWFREETGLETCLYDGDFVGFLVVF